LKQESNDTIDFQLFKVLTKQITLKAFANFEHGFTGLSQDGTVKASARSGSGVKMWSSGDNEK
jgi:hypothetical protein